MREQLTNIFFFVQCDSLLAMGYAWILRNGVPECCDSATTGYEPLVNENWVSSIRSTGPS